MASSFGQSSAIAAGAALDDPDPVVQPHRQAGTDHVVGGTVDGDAVLTGTTSSRSRNHPRDPLLVHVAMAAQ